jgi:predicted amidohydrolase YtcJ
VKIAAALFFAAATLTAQKAAQEPAPKPADMVLINGKVVTLDAKNLQTDAIAIRDGNIAGIGSNAFIRKTIGPSTKVIDLKGALAVPGLIEGHGHFAGVGRTRLELNLRDAQTWDDIVAKVADAVKKAKPGEWIIGRGWHQEKWSKPPAPSILGFPVHDTLSKASPDNPVILTHASGHAVFVNAAAMAKAGITRTTPNPSGGEIAKDSSGNPTGLLAEQAQGLVQRARAMADREKTPAQREADTRQELELAAEESLSKGLTTFQDAGSPFSTIDVMRKMADEGKLGIRLWVMIGDSNAAIEKNIAKYKVTGESGGFITVRAIKKYMDGALGSRGAWFLEPYTDQPDTSGFRTGDAADMRRTAEIAIAHGLQLCIHAIGDRANRETLDLYEQIFKENPEKKNLRWRIEHAQHLSAEDIPRFAKLGVIASMQGIHCTSDAPFVIPRLGPKRAEEGAYVWRKLIDSGAVVSNGTDAPVEDVDPLPNYYASVTRRLKDGTIFYPAQKMTRLEALRSMTVQPAYAGFEERTKGSLVTGKLADITVIDRDILTVPDDKIPGAKVLYTIVGGKIAYQAK